MLGYVVRVKETGKIGTVISRLERLDNPVLVLVMLSATASPYAFEARWYSVDQVERVSVAGQLIFEPAVLPLPPAPALGRPVDRGP